MRAQPTDADPMSGEEFLALLCELALSRGRRYAVEVLHQVLAELSTEDQLYILAEMNIVLAEVEVPS